jgi:hypothetical protein
MKVLRLVALGLAVSAAAACHDGPNAECSGDDSVASCLPPDALDEPGTALFAGRARPIALAHDGDRLYWLEWGQLDALDNYTPGALVRATFEGQPEVVVDDVSRPRWIASDATHIYWTEEGRIARWPKLGGAPETVVADVDAIELAVGPTHIAWRQVQVEPGVYVAPKAGGDAFLIDPTEDADIVAIDDERVYYGYLGTVVSEPIGGGAVETLIDGQPYRLAIHDDVLVAGLDTRIVRLDLPDGAPVNIANQPEGNRPELAVFNDELFFAFESAGAWTLMRARLTPITATPIASETGDLRGIAVGDGHLYWITGGDETAPNGAIHHAPL